MRVRVFRDRESLAEAAVEEIAAWLRVDAETPTIGLAGGSTPRPTYERLRRLLKRQCENEGLDFDKAFPPPPKQLRPEAGGVQPGGEAPGI